jgi:hypothetical protein
VSQRNSFQGRRADPAGAGAGARGTGNSPRPACGPSLSQEIAHFQEDFYRKEHKELKEKNLWSFSFALQSVRIAQFREDFFSALSATLRAPREKGKLVAACRTASSCGNSFLAAAGRAAPWSSISMYCGKPVPSLFKAFFLSEKWSHKHLSDSIFLTSLRPFQSCTAISMFASVAAGRAASYLSFLPHQSPPANPALSAKNSLFGAVPMKAAKGC